MNRTTERIRSWNPDLVCPAVLFVAGILFFADPLFSSKNFFFRDILNFHYPLRKILVDSYASGEFPLWNPFIYLGQPMLANPNYMAFYPTNLLNLFLSFNYAFKLHFILHPIAAGIGLYFFLRRLSLGPWAALAGSLVYQFSGTVLSFLNLYNIVPAVALMPWIGWAFLGALDRPGRTRILILGGILGIQVLALEPLMFFCEASLLAGLAFYYGYHSPDRWRAIRNILRAACGGGAFAACLAAVQILPTLELLPLSGRGAGFDFEEVTLWSVHPLDLLNTIIPNLFGNYFTIGLSTSWGEAVHNGRESYLISFFLGTGVFLLAGLSLLSVRRRLAALFAAQAALGLVLSLGHYNPIYSWLWKNIPILQLGRYPSKYFLLTAFSLAVLAAIGFETLFAAEARSARGKRWRWTVAGGGGLIGLLFLGYWQFWPRHSATIESWIRRCVGSELVHTKDYPAILGDLAGSVLSSAAFILICSLIVAAAPVFRRPNLLRALLLVVVSAELLPVNLRLMPLISDADVDFVPEVNRFLREKGPREPYRVVPPTLLRRMPPLWVSMPNRSSAWLTLFFRMSGQPFYGIMEGIQYSLDRTVDHLDTREAKDLWRACTLLPESDALTLLAKLNSPMILMMEELKHPGVRFLGSFDTLSDRKLNVFWMENTIARAYFVSGVEKAASPREALNRFVRPDFPFGSTVVLESASARNAGGEEGSGKARLLRHDGRRVTCEVEARRAGYLVLLDSYYPGWRAEVDGQPAEILKANYAFRAVPVAAGRHIVEFYFRPYPFYAGLAISALSLVLASIVVVADTRKRRRSLDSHEQGAAPTEPQGA